MKKLSQKGLDLIKRFEGIRLIAYKAVPTEKYYTIGYGHYGADVQRAQRITEEQAEEMLRKDVQRFVDVVNQYVKVNLTQNQFDALVSFAYNVGATAFRTSTLLLLLNSGSYSGAANEFDKWNKSGGRVLTGLVRRRSEEKALFNTKEKVASVTAINGIRQVGKIRVNKVKNFTYIYSKPSDTSKVLGEAHKNVTFGIAGSVKGWYEVIHKGSRAYIKDKYCTRI